MSYIDKVKAIRKKHNYSQKDMAQLLDTTQQQYSKYENQQQEMPIRHLVTICSHFKVSSDWLLDIDTKEGGTIKIAEGVVAPKPLGLVKIKGRIPEFLRSKLRNDLKLIVQKNLPRIGFPGRFFFYGQIGRGSGYSVPLRVRLSERLASQSHRQSLTQGFWDYAQNLGENE